MFRVTFPESVKHQIHSVLKSLIFLPYFGGIEHFQQCGHVLFFLWGLVEDVRDERLIVKGFRFRPEIVSAFGVLAFRVFHNAIDEFENVVFIPDIAKRIVFHRLPEVDGIEDLDFISSLFQHLPAFK